MKNFYNWLINEHYKYSKGDYESFSDDLFFFSGILSSLLTIVGVVLNNDFLFASILFWVMGVGVFYMILAGHGVTKFVKRLRADYREHCTNQDEKIKTD